ncbi:unnamed protein product [Adineta steineri]|uniref:G-protein coupled receptors family 1 profile domain-containing protein n=1 Tax=Adineta steineri TaxID=433720 RepID=A0A814LIF8_9BILA|nr:unnamed protein product [Adineta steineri]CAF1065728.1 unnamed protein product [Adineta steineri]CAF3680572.1 unnamed protein product [Adineta steineri]CAF3831336.1 unnamed protein product [Adineta steineri]
MSNITTNSSSIIVGDDQAQLIALVNLLNKTISQYGLGLIWFVGNIGSILNCIVFSQPTYSKSPCAMHFLASSVAQFFTFNFALLTRLLQYGYGIQGTNIYVWFCKVRFYLFYIFVAVPRYNIVMASVDRYFASSRSALRRQWSSSKIAIRLIIGNIIFCCSYGSGAYGIFFSIYISIDSGILPLLLMLIFGLLAVNNIHKTRRRIDAAPTGNPGRPAQAAKMSKKDIQLHRMLANQICLFIILNMPNPCYLVYRSFTITQVKSPFRRATETFLSNMTYALIHLGFSLTFANFFISSDIYRREFLQVIRIKILRQTSASTATEGGTPIRVLR